MLRGDSWGVEARMCSMCGRDLVWSWRSCSFSTQGFRDIGKADFILLRVHVCVFVRVPGLGVCIGLEAGSGYVGTEEGRGERSRR